MKYIFYILIFLLAFTSSANQELNKYWNWNSVEVSLFPGGSSISEVNKKIITNMSGAATVDISANEITITIYSADYWDEPVRISGSFLNKKIQDAVVYRVDKTDGDYILSGEYRMKKYTKNCVFEEIILKHPDAHTEFQILTRSSSTCSSKEFSEEYEESN